MKQKSANCFESEEWNDIPDYEGLYQASSLGRIKSVARCRKGKNGGLVPMEERILKQSVGKNNYCYVSLSKDGVVKFKTVHRLICSAFVENPDHLPCVDHIDGNRVNNNITNLRWCTTKDNLNFEMAKRNMSITSKNSVKCQEHRRNIRKLFYKPVVATLHDGTTLRFKSIKEASDYLKCDRHEISKCCYGLRKFYKNNTFKFE